MQYSVCFAVESSYQAGGCQQTFFAAKVHGHPEQYCVDVTVQRCRYCPANNGESLVDIAQAWGGSSNSYLQVCRSSSSLPVTRDMYLCALFLNIYARACRKLKFCVFVQELPCVLQCVSCVPLGRCKNTHGCFQDVFLSSLLASL